MNSSNPRTEHFDVLIIGSGLAGLTAALLLAPTHRVAVVTKRDLRDGASGWAQGGLAAVMADGDTTQQHVDDTLVAGAGLCDLDATRAVVEGAPAAIAWLRELGVAFSQDPDQPGELHLTREGGHSQRRIVHAADATGAEVQRTLVSKVLKEPRITLFEHHMLVDLIMGAGDAYIPRCSGAYVLDVTTGRIQAFTASHTILATGGAGRVYLHSTNPDTATGDGIAAAWRAGCRVGNMEFVQFHPTSLCHPDAHSFLISEAVRGEGGQLLLPTSKGGTRFMPAHDSRAELAPRDVVARAIDFEMKTHALDCVYLDISHQSPAFLHEHFPNILQRCLALGIDITRQPIPVVPAAHYTCGGVMTGLDGQTDVAGLYAIGETACTGLHGANRLASNSLVECLVLARAAAEAIGRQQPVAAGPVSNGQDDQTTPIADTTMVADKLDELRRLMWDDVGIVRTTAGLARAAHRIAQLRSELKILDGGSRVTRESLELRNLAQVAELIVQSAQGRHESRGLHFSRDYPDTAASASPSILVPAEA